MRTKNEKSKITKALLETAHALAGRDEVPADQDVTRESYRSLSEAAQYFARKTAEEIRRLPTDLRCVFRRSWTANPEEGGHSFRRNLDRDSEGRWTPGPKESDQAMVTTLGVRVSSIKLNLP